MAMLARVTGGAPVGSHRPCPTVVRVRRDRAQVAAAAAAQSARSEWAQFALEHGVEQMVSAEAPRALRLQGDLFLDQNLVDPESAAKVLLRGSARPR